MKRTGSETPCGAGTHTGGPHKRLKTYKTSRRCGHVWGGVTLWVPALLFGTCTSGVRGNGTPRIKSCFNPQRESMDPSGACIIHRQDPAPPLTPVILLFRSCQFPLSPAVKCDRNTGSALALDPALQPHYSKTTAALPHRSSSLRTHGVPHLLSDALLIRADRLVGEFPDAAVVADHPLLRKHDRLER